MDPKRLRDAHRLLDKLPAEEWVETYARDVLEMAFKRDEENARKGFESLSKVSMSGAKLHRGVHGAVLSFQRTVGGGDAKRGEESLGTGLKPTKARWATAILFYQQIRATGEGPRATIRRSFSPTPGRGRSGGEKLTCSYCTTRAVGRCRRCDAHVCENHLLPTTGECSEGPEGEDMPLHAETDPEAVAELHRQVPRLRPFRPG